MPNLPSAPKSLGIDEIDELGEAFGDYEMQSDLVDELEENEDLDSDRIKIRAVGWGMGALAPLVESEPIDLIFEPSINEYNGEKSVQCTINSLEPTGSPEQFPDREALVHIYKFLRMQSRSETLKPFDLCKLAAEFRRSPLANDNPKLNSIYTLSSAVQVFCEIGLMRLDFEGKNFFMPIPKGKFDLNRSRIFALNNEGVDNE